MKTIGLIGGMSWKSSIEYYRLINEFVSKKLGGLHSANLIMYSVEFEPMEKLQREERWEEISLQINDIGKRLEIAGSDFIVLCTNTTHHIADSLEKAISIPLLHIATATANVIKNKKIKTVGFLGTSYTCKYSFYRKKLESSDIAVLLPNQVDIELINSIIYKELAQGIINHSSKNSVLEIIKNLIQSGAEGIVLGCTELPLLITPDDVTHPLLNTLEIHAEAAASFSIK